jgi:serine/threonine protein kinase
MPEPAELPGPDHATEPADRERLRRSAAALSRIEHPNVVQVKEVGEGEKETVVIYQTVRSVRLGDAVSSLSAAQLCRTFANVSATLAKLHSAGIVHGALKPDLLLYTQSGRVVLHGFVDERDRAILVSTDDDVSELLEIARAYLPKTLQNNAAISRPALRKTASVASMEKQLKRLLMNDELPSADQLIGFFTSWANKFPQHIASRSNTSTPRYMHKRRISRINIAAACLIIFLVAAWVFGDSSVTKATPPKPESHHSIKTVEINETKYSTGESKVKVVSGNFHCDGQTQALLLRPDQGTLWEFALSDQLTTSGKLIKDKISAKNLEVVHHGGCDSALLIDDNNTALQVEL